MGAPGVVDGFKSVPIRRLFVEVIDVLVVGGGVSGSAAAWQAARLGASVIVAEPTPWLGGMITAAGVSALDGNKGAMATGFLRRFRDRIDAHYGGPQNVRTGWISDTSFEPHVGARIMAELVADPGNGQQAPTVWHGAQLVEVHREGDRITGATFDHDGTRKRVAAKVTIEATEFGDVLAAGGVPFRLGRDARSETGEAHAPEVADNEVQDMTWVATLKQRSAPYPPGHLVPRPADYNPDAFDGAVIERCKNPDPALLNHHLHDFESFITYALLPRDKYLLNWPFHSNDSPDSYGIFGTPADRARAFDLARRRTLAFVHFMQNDLGHPEWGLADDEYGTPDGLAFIPYVRESRRVVGSRLLVMDDVLPPRPGGPRARIHSDSIAVGDYFLDHHHSKAHLPPDQRLVEDYPDNAPFQIPYGCLVPATVDGLICAEKSISVTHIVNGCSRLQPVVMLLGQAAGAAAALCAKAGIEPRALDVAQLQRLLVRDEKVMLFPFWDLEHTHPAFVAAQELALRGFFDEEEPMKLDPEDPITPDEMRTRLERWAEHGGSRIEADALAGDHPTRGEFLQRVAARSA